MGRYCWQRSEQPMSPIENSAQSHRDNCMRTSRNTRWHYVILVAAIIGSFFVAGSTLIPTDGELDPSFGNGGIVLTDFNNSTDLANAVALQPDGKVVAAGTTYIDNDFSDE